MRFPQAIAKVGAAGGRVLSGVLQRVAADAVKGMLGMQGGRTQKIEGLRVMGSLIEQIVTEVSATSFFKELCYSAQQFALPDGGTEELADLFVWLESDGIVIQIKERDEDADASDAAFDKWFKRQVISDGSDQIARSLSFFKKHPALKVKNRRGFEYELQALDAARMQKMIVFGSLADGPDQHHRLKSHLSKRSGLIHLIQSVDFTNLLRLAATPGEILEYLRFREDWLSKHESARTRSEKWLFGCFVHWSRSDGPQFILGEVEGENVIDSLKDDVTDVDMREFMDYIGSWAAGQPDKQRGFQRLIVECAHLNRAGMREFKTRIKKCLSRLDKPAPYSLYRILAFARDCVFVFGVSRRGPLEEVQSSAASYVGAAMYLDRISKGIGFFFTPFDDDKTGTTPVYIEMPWEENAELAQVVEELKPFMRPINRSPGSSYSLNETEDSDAQ